MRTTRPALVLSGVISLVAVAAALWGLDAFAAQAGVVALGLPAVAVVLSRRATATAVWWSLLAGLVVLAVALGVEDGREPVDSGLRYLEPARAGSGSFVAAVVDRERLTTLAVLAAVLTFLPAVRASGRRPWAAAPIALVGLLPFVAVAADMWVVAGAGGRDGATAGALGELLGATWLPLAVTAVVVVVAVLAPAPLITAGAALLAVSGLGVVYRAVLSAPLPLGHDRRLLVDALLGSVLRGGLDPVAALTLAGYLFGACCLVAGCLRAGARE